MCDMTHAYVWHAVFISIRSQCVTHVTWRIHNTSTTLVIKQLVLLHSYVWHAWCIFVMCHVESSIIFIFRAEYHSYSELYHIHIQSSMILIFGTFWFSNSEFDRILIEWELHNIHIQSSIIFLMRRVLMSITSWCLTRVRCGSFMCVCRVCVSCASNMCVCVMSSASNIHTATHCNTLQHPATHTAIHCNTL